MKRNIKFIQWTILLLTIVAVTFVSCKDDDDDNSGQVILEAYGPSPSPRGGMLTFIGENMDKVTSVVLPTDINITDIDVISPEKIKVTIPQNAKVGYVKLVTPDGDITTKTLLTYTEPISVTKISPVSIKAGQTLTVEGDYLNLIQKVIFAEDVVVTFDDFTTWERAKLALLVPKEAQTGRIVFSDTTSTPFELTSDSILQVTLPSVPSVVTPVNKKPGDEMSITGVDLDLVESVVLPNDSTVDFTVTGNTFAFTLPVGTTDGLINMVTYSGISIPVAQITMAVPTELIAEPASGLRGSDEITITGTDMDLITTVLFAGTTDTITPSPISATEVKLTMPATAISGDITLNTASGNTATVTIETQKPVVTNLSSTTPAPGDNLTIIGTDLDLVTAVTFGGDAVGEISSQSAAEIVVPVPAFAEDGTAILTMANGETVITEELDIQAPEYCYIAVLPDTTIKAGIIFAIDVENIEVLTDVQVNGASTQYIAQNSTLSILIPNSSNGTTKLTLVSSNGSVDYDIDVVASGLVETVLYNSPIDIVEWKGADLPYIVEVPMPANSKIRIYVSQANSELQVMDGYWGQGPNWKITDDDKKNVIHFSVEELSAGYVDVDFSGFHDENDNPWWDGKIKFNANGVIVSSVSLIVDYSAPTAIWNGSSEVSGWKTSFTDLTWNGYDFSGLEVGQTIYVYYTAAASATMRLGNGNWVAFPSTIPIAEASGDTSGKGDIIIAAGNSSISFTLTAEDIASIQDKGGFGAYGGDYVVTKVAIK